MELPANHIIRNTEDYGDDVGGYNKMVGCVVGRHGDDHPNAGHGVSWGDGGKRGS